MTKRKVEEFVSRVSLLVPDLFRRTYFQGAEDYEDTAVLEFRLPSPIDIEELMDMLEDDLRIITGYHVIPTAATKLGQRCMAYSNPVTTEMFKVNAQSDDNGEVDTVFVTLYESLMTMGMEVRSEIVEMAGKYKAKYARAEADVLRDFMR